MDAKSSSSSYPSFSSLPLDPTGPRGNAWGLFPPSSTPSPSKDASATKDKDKDQLGMLNHLTPSTTLSAAKEIQYGIRISTDWVMDEPKVPCFGRRAFEQRIVSKAPRTVNDDVLEFNTQGGSQWDGFRHFGYQEAKVFFNGCTQHEVENSKRNGIHAWVEKGGIVGRGVLLDYVRWSQSQGRQIDPLTTQLITVSDLKAIAASQGVTFQPGDIFFLYTGFLSALRDLGDLIGAYAAQLPPPAIGVRSGKEELEWFWEQKFAAVASDCIAFEALPFQSTEFWIHEWFLAGWGLPIGELFDLEPLSKACADKKKWTFWFSSMPLKVPGGVASPPNGVAIL